MLKLTILEEKLMDSIPSGSAIAMHAGKMIIIADDAPFIYSVSPEDYSYDATPLTGYASSPYRIPKPVKPDFEAATKGLMNGKEYLFAFGSGSKSPSRDSLLIVDPDSLAVQRIISLSLLYQSLKEQLKIDDAQWNIEGAATEGSNLLLLNRGNNGVIIVKWNEWLQFMEKGTLPSAGTFELKLPSFNGHIARLSGASVLNNKGDILFCASIEDTPNWYTDGPVLGSYIGIFNTRERETRSIATVKDKSGKVIAEKIESVEVITSKGSSAEIVAIADDDKGHTKVFRILLER